VIRPRRSAQAGELALTPPFDAAAALGNLRAHAIPGAEVAEPGSHTRLIPAASGAVVVTITPTTDALLATVETDDPADTDAVVATLRQWLDLDHDPTSVADALGTDPLVGELVAARPGLRVLGTAHPFETAVMTVLGQQVSLAAARTLGGRLVATFGTPGPGRLTAFPDAAALAAVHPELLQRTVGLTGARARSILALSQAVADGMPLVPPVDPTEFRAGLLDLPGIGPWTVDYLTLRLLGDRDAFVPGDLVLRRTLASLLGHDVSVRQADAASEAWRPWRAYALMHLWTSTSY
jgi:3-methyladenine DNA glycosylase/8-oxoguanine DNA glycosylase